jgi:hypothetical protein
MLHYPPDADGLQDRVMQKPFKAADLVHMMKGLVLQATPEPTTHRSAEAITQDDGSRGSEETLKKEIDPEHNEKLK